MSNIAAQLANNRDRKMCVSFSLGRLPHTRPELANQRGGWGTKGTTQGIEGRLNAQTYAWNVDYILKDEGPKWEWESGTLFREGGSAAGDLADL